MFHEALIICFKIIVCQNRSQITGIFPVFLNIKLKVDFGFFNDANGGILTFEDELVQHIKRYFCLLNDVRLHIYCLCRA